jgi:hypothetical protein
MTLIPIGFCEVQVGIVNTNNSHIDSISFGLNIEPVAEDLVNAIGVLNAALPDLAQDMHPDYTMTTLRFTFPAIPSGTGSVEATLPDPAPGGNAGALMDPRIACIYNKGTNVLGRRGRGRFYLPGVIDGEVGSNGQIEGAAATARNNHASSFLDKIQNPDDPLLGLSMELLHSTAPDTPTEVVGLSITPLIARIRRRG